VTPRTLALEIVTPDGVALSETGVDVVIFRRQERRFALGSEIAVFPRHAPLLVRIPIAPVRYRRRGETVHLAVGGGFAEVLNDTVLIITPRVEHVSSAVPDPHRAASAICRRWQRTMADVRREMAGYP
jgi:F-type H+-transporting ATPase subunit epsilon